ncbi:MAG: response regulator, partial [Deltaproteobacteria bacterium]|nr:response regulator [Deltaproteobacteria bacterium]
KGTLRVDLRRRWFAAVESAGTPGTAPGFYVVLTVSDTGCGMDSAILERIYEPYFTTKAVGKGSGLGLAVTHGIVKRHRGFIQVASEPGRGSTFQVCIPVVEDASPATAAVVVEDASLKGRERILLVDDESLVVDVGQDILRIQGYVVTGLSDAREALALIKARPDFFDLLITDQTMPQLTGVELAVEVLKIRPTLPIILCTGYSAVLTEKEALGIGVKKYLAKPVDMQTLLQTVRQVLNEGRSESGPVRSAKGTDA